MEFWVIDLIGTNYCDFKNVLDQYLK